MGKAGLKKKRKMAANSSFFAEVKTPFQKIYDGVVFPSVLSPTVAPSALPGAVKEQKAWLESVLLRHGAILFRGLGSSATASDFNDFVEAFGYEDQPYLGGSAPRNTVVGRVVTANESPPHREIPFHHEMSHVDEHPRKVFFFCEQAAASGGETPILLSHVVYDKMKEKYPEFVEKLEKVGLKYARIMGEEDDPSSAIGRGWKSTFYTSDRIEAQQRAEELKIKLEWMENGLAKMIIGPVAAIRCDERRQRKIWFNTMAAAYTAWVDERNDPKKNVRFGDGSPLPEAIMHDCLKMMEEESTSFGWERGDVLMIDNHAALHARNCFTPPRTILAALCK